VPALLQILELIGPPTNRRATYRDQQLDLCNLSLVSRRLRHIAQPLLRKVVRITSSHRAEPITTAALSMGWGHLVSEIVFDKYTDGDALGLLATTFHKASNLKLVNHSRNVFELSLLTRFSSECKLR